MARVRANKAHLHGWGCRVAKVWRQHRRHMLLKLGDGCPHDALRRVREIKPARLRPLLGMHGDGISARATPAAAAGTSGAMAGPTHTTGPPRAPLAALSRLVLVLVLVLRLRLRLVLVAYTRGGNHAGYVA